MWQQRRNDPSCMQCCHDRPSFRRETDYGRNQIAFCLLGNALDIADGHRVDMATWSARDLRDRVVAIRRHPQRDSDRRPRGNLIPN